MKHGIFAKLQPIVPTGVSHGDLEWRDPADDPGGPAMTRGVSRVRLKPFGDQVFDIFLTFQSLTSSASADLQALMGYDEPGNEAQFCAVRVRSARDSTRTEGPSLVGRRPSLLG